MQAGALVASRYELVAPVASSSPHAWRAEDRHLGRPVVVVFAEADDAAADTSGHPGRVLDGGVADGRRFLVVEGGLPFDEDHTQVQTRPLVAPAPMPRGDRSMAQPAVAADATAATVRPGPAGAPPAHRPRRRRGVTRAAGLTLASFGLGAATVVAYGVLTAPDPRVSGAGARATVPERDPAADAQPTRTLPGVAVTVAPPTTSTTAASTTSTTTATTARPTTTARPSTTKPTTTTTAKKPETTATTTTSRRRRSRDDARR